MKAEEEKVCWESMCQEAHVSQAEMSEIKRHGMTDGLAVKCEEMGVSAKCLRDLFFQFGPPCIPILMEFTHKAKPKKEPAHHKPAKADDKEDKKPDAKK